MAVAPPAPVCGITADQSAKQLSVIVPRVVDNGVACPRCGACFGHKTTNTYPNGNRRKICGGCGRPFVVMRPKAAISG